jgi:hypothetical protein
MTFEERSALFASVSLVVWYGLTPSVIERILLTDQGTEAGAQVASDEVDKKGRGKVSRTSRIFPVLFFVRVIAA